MNPDILMLFEKYPAALPLYETMEQRILAEFPDVRMKVGRTQVGFSNRHGFAYVWPPPRKIKGRPGVYIVVTFGLCYKMDHPLIVEAVEPYPNRWTHHVIVSDISELDSELMGWIWESYDFSMSK